MSAGMLFPFCCCVLGKLAGTPVVLYQAGHWVTSRLKSLPQHHNSKASSLWHSAFLMVQLTHLYMTTGKNIALIIHNFVCKLMSLFFNTLTKFIIVFLPRNKWLLISWLQSESTVILEPNVVKSATFSIFSPSIALM